LWHNAGGNRAIPETLISELVFSAVPILLAVMPDVDQAFQFVSIKSSSHPEPIKDGIHHELTKSREQEKCSADSKQDFEHDHTFR
jgi:hypothetical protein